MASGPPPLSTNSVVPAVASPVAPASISSAAEENVIQRMTVPPTWLLLSQAHARVQLTLVPLDPSHHAARLRPALSLVAEAREEHQWLLRWTASGLAPAFLEPARAENSSWPLPARADCSSEAFRSRR